MSSSQVKVLTTYKEFSPEGEKQARTSAIKYNIQIVKFEKHVFFFFFNVKPWTITVFGHLYAYQNLKPGKGSKVAFLFFFANCLIDQETENS